MKFLPMIIGSNVDVANSNYDSNAALVLNAIDKRIQYGTIECIKRTCYFIAIDVIEDGGFIDFEVASNGTFLDYVDEIKYYWEDTKIRIYYELDQYFEFDCIKDGIIDRIIQNYIELGETYQQDRRDYQRSVFPINRP